MRRQLELLKTERGGASIGGGLDCLGFGEPVAAQPRQVCGAYRPMQESARPELRNADGTGRLSDRCNLRGGQAGMFLSSRVSRCRSGVTVSVWVGEKVSARTFLAGGTRRVEEPDSPFPFHQLQLKMQELPQRYLTYA